MKIGSWLQKMGNALIQGLRRFPAAVLLSVAITGIILTLNHRSDLMTDAVHDDWTRALAVCVMGFPLVLVLHLALERMQRPPAYKPVGLLAIAAFFLPAAAGLTVYAWYLLPEFEMIPMVRLVMLTAALVLLFVFLPFWWRREGIALHSTRLLTRLLVTVLYAGILMMALFAILFTLEKLLNVRIVDDHYTDTATGVWALFAPLFFISGIPGVREVPQPADSPKTLRFLLHWILIPLLWVYTAILYVYSAKILIEREWPRSLVSSLILAYLCVGLLVWLLSSPVKSDTKLASFHHIAFPWAALPLFGILFTALFIRINEYGITEGRWFAFVLAVWCAFSIVFLSLRSLFRKRNPESAGMRLIVLPLSLALVAVSTVVGPVNAFAVSIRSQNTQLETVLERNGMLEAGQAKAAGGNVGKEDLQRIISILYWFKANHGLDEVDSLPNISSLSDAETHLAINFDNSAPDNRYQYVQYLSEEEVAPVSVAGYDLMFSIGYDDRMFRDEATGLEFRMDQGVQRLTLRRDGIPLKEMDLTPIFRKLAEQYGEGAALGEVRIPAAEMTFDDTTGGIETRIILRRIGGNPSLDSADGGKPGSVEGWLLVKLPQ